MSIKKVSIKKVSMFAHSRIVLCLLFSLAATLPPVPSLSQASVSKASDVAPSAQKTTDTKTPSKQVISLFNAAEQGDTAKVRDLLDAGVSVKSQAPNGLTPLILASMMNHPETVKLLIESGADINAALVPGASISGATALIVATSTFGNIMAGAKMPDSPKGYDGHEIEFMKQHPDQVRTWEQKTEAWSKGYDVITRMLIDHGADVNAETALGTTAISNAADSGNLEMVRLLLDKGARLDLPIHGLLLIEGKPQDATNGYAALVGASSMSQHNPEIIKLLLTHGAKPNCQSLDDLTPLGRASESGDLEVVRLLLAAGATVNAYDPFGRTALMRAQDNHHANVAAELRKAGAKDLPREPFAVPTVHKVKPETSHTPKTVPTLRNPSRGNSSAVRTITRHVEKPKNGVK